MKKIKLLALLPLLALTSCNEVYKTPVGWCYEEVKRLTDNIICWEYTDVAIEGNDTTTLAYIITTYNEPSEYPTEYDVIIQKWLCVIDVKHTNNFDAVFGRDGYTANDIRDLDCDLIYTMYIEEAADINLF